MAHLTRLLVKDQFQWSPEAQLAFETLKDAICTTSFLGLLDFSQPFVVETDASGVGMEVVLTQQNHPIAFFNKPFCTKLLHSSTYVRELATIMVAVKK